MSGTAKKAPVWAIVAKADPELICRRHALYDCRNCGETFYGKVHADVLDWDVERILAAFPKHRPYKNRLRERIRSRLLELDRIRERAWSVQDRMAGNRPGANGPACGKGVR